MYKRYIMPLYNPWHGCRKFSEGCLNCYVFRTDGKHGLDPSQVHKTSSFALPLKKGGSGYFSLLPDSGSVYTCLSSDFFIEDADPWRPDVWRMISARPDLDFIIITKRIHRFNDCLPPDWGSGYGNVQICCTCENQKRADERLPVLLSAPIAHRSVICEPMLGAVDISAYLASGLIESVTAGGESGDSARPCDFSWIQGLRSQCAAARVSFRFKQTGAVFIKDGSCFHIPRSRQLSQAEKAGLNLYFPREGEM